jgi:nucleotide-binding universal stress UspA family protein
MGAYGHSRIRQFLVGSNTAKMVRMSDIPILLLR